MKLIASAFVALFLGILLGGYGPSAELDRLQKLDRPNQGLFAAVPEPCDSNVGSDLATLLGNGVGRADTPPLRDEPETPDPRAAELAAEIDAAGEQAEAQLRDGIEAAANNEEELELARTALELRRAQARAALLEDSDAEDEQMEQFDTAVDAMNGVLLDLTEEMTEMVEGGREPGRREAMEFAADALDALLSAEDNMRSAFRPDQLAEVEDSAIDPFSHIDPAIIDVLEGLDFGDDAGRDAGEGEQL